ncbi:hypothetical protein [Bordetella genomosp. 4]|uniref:hypothetical protein n=1 Tax=Bordetella genomosp. 4 TaxID=463044 RepID=UPI0020CFDB90|nr:hypothetical protein [Bordetella genomosp. 4]
MKRELLARVAAITVIGAMAGGAYAQSTPNTGVPYSSSPSTTPNDGTAVPPNTPVPPGQIPPAGQTNPAQRGQGYAGDRYAMPTGAGGDSCVPGSKTGLQLDHNYVPNRQETAINEVRTSDMCGTR